MKRALNLIVSAFVIAVLAPLLAMIAVLIWCGYGAPVLYRQERVGKRMRVFTLYKFRTMVNDADRAGQLTSNHDARVTGIGRLLRRWKLDELPQIFNVMNGDMQLVGCRPEVPRYVEQFRSEYTELLQERPGITDPASLAFRDEERLLAGPDFEQKYVHFILPTKLMLSLDYARKRTLWSDATILANTIFRVIVPKSCASAANGLPPQVSSEAK